MPNKGLTTNLEAFFPSLNWFISFHTQGTYVPLATGTSCHYCSNTSNFHTKDLSKASRLIRTLEHDLTRDICHKRLLSVTTCTRLSCVHIIRPRWVTLISLLPFYKKSFMRYLHSEALYDLLLILDAYKDFSSEPQKAFSLKGLGREVCTWP